MWKPETEADIELAISEGTLVESHTLDAKRLSGNSDRERKATAQDLASFALDGGALIIGVDEDKAAGTFSLAPLDLAGAMEKIEQSAATRIDPPLHVRISEIKTAARPDRGYLFVEVPPSPQAPHMVDNVYFARGDRTTRRLGDAEVARLHAARASTGNGIRDELERLVDNDPVPVDERLLSHFYFVAEPRNATLDAAVDLVRQADRFSLTALLMDAERQIHKGIADSPPRLLSADSYRRRSRGVALTTRAEEGWNRHQRSEKSLLDVEVRENGGVRVTVGRGSDQQKQINDMAVVAHTLRLVHWARALSERIEYRGSWDFAVGGTSLYGTVAAGEKGVAGESTYEVDDYREVTSAHLSEMADSPGAVANRLIGPLLRGLGVDADHAKYMADRTK